MFFSQQNDFSKKTCENVLEDGSVDSRRRIMTVPAASKINRAGDRDVCSQQNDFSNKTPFGLECCQNVFQAIPGISLFDLEKLVCAFVQVQKFTGPLAQRRVRLASGVALLGVGEGAT